MFKFILLQLLISTQLFAVNEKFTCLSEIRVLSNAVNRCFFEIHSSEWTEPFVSNVFELGKGVYGIPYQSGFLLFTDDSTTGTYYQLEYKKATLGGISAKGAYPLDPSVEHQFIQIEVKGKGNFYLIAEYSPDHIPEGGTGISNNHKIKIIKNINDFDKAQINKDLTIYSKVTTKSQNKTAKSTLGLVSKIRNFIQSFTAVGVNFQIEIS